VEPVRARRDESRYAIVIEKPVVRPAGWVYTKEMFVAYVTHTHGRGFEPWVKYTDEDIDIEWDEERVRNGGGEEPHRQRHQR